jgi:hypothetical protein
VDALNRFVDNELRAYARAWDFRFPIFGSPGTSLGTQEPGIDI